VVSEGTAPANLSTKGERSERRENLNLCCNPNFEHFDNGKPQCWETSAQSSFKLIDDRTIDTKTIEMQQPTGITTIFGQTINPSALQEGDTLDVNVSARLLGKGKVYLRIFLPYSVDGTTMPREFASRLIPEDGAWHSVHVQWPIESGGLQNLPVIYVQFRIENIDAPMQVTRPLITYVNLGL